jgi:hypothetical protein
MAGCCDNWNQPHGSIKGVEILDWTNISFSRSTLLHAVSLLVSQLIDYHIPLRRIVRPWSFDTNDADSQSEIPEVQFQEMYLDFSLSTKTFKML